MAPLIGHRSQGSQISRKFLLRMPSGNLSGSVFRCDSTYPCQSFIVSDCICAPPKRGRYWEIHPRPPGNFPRPEGNLEGRGKSRGRRGWISQYRPSFGGIRTFSSSSIHLQGWIRKSVPVGREGLTVLKSILPC